MARKPPPPLHPTWAPAAAGLEPKPRDPVAASCWAWGPHAGTLLVALVGVGLARSGARAALDALPLLACAPGLIVAVLVRFGRSPRLAYPAACIAAVGVWGWAAGTGTWWLAAVLVGLVVGAAAGWVTWRQDVPVGATALAVFTAAVLTSLAFRPDMASPTLKRWALAWVVGTACAAGPWWWERRRVKAAVPVVVADLDRLLEVWGRHAGTRFEVQQGSVTADHLRWSVTLRTTEGVTTRKVQHAIEATETELSWRPGALTLSASPVQRGLFTATVTPDAPDQSQPRPDLPTSILMPVQVGWYDDGRPMLVSIYDVDNGSRHMLAGGRVGSGKSQFLATLLEGWTATGEVCIFFADRSGGATSAPWAPCSAGTAATHEDCALLLNAATEIITYRSSLLPGMDVECWPASRDLPAIIVVCEEMQNLNKGSYEAKHSAIDIVQRGRKAGVGLVMLAPRPCASEGIDPTLRDQAAFRACMATDGSTSDFVFDRSAASEMAGRVTEFDQPGQVLMAGPGVDPRVAGRGLPTPLARAKAAAAAHAGRQPALDAGSAGVLARVTGGKWGRPAEGGGDGAGVPLVKSTPRAARSAAEDSESDRAMERVLAVLARDDARPAAPAPAAAPRLQGEAAWAVAWGLLVRPGGASPAEVVRATGMSRSAVHDRLARWVREGAARAVEYGRYQADGDVA